jgi:hypothetical protein
LNKALATASTCGTGKTNAAITSASFAFEAPANAKKLNADELKDFDELPAIFKIAKAKRAGLICACCRQR